MQSLIKFQSVIVGSLARRSLVCRVEYSPFVFQFLKILRRSGYIYGFQFTGTGFSVYLRYLNGTPTITQMNLISKPGSRVYVHQTQVRRFSRKFPQATHIVSTTDGLKTFPTISSNSKRKIPTGEYLFRVW